MASRSNCKRRWSKRLARRPQSWRRSKRWHGDWPGGAGAIFEANRHSVLQRQAVLETVAGLKEREMLKLATLCAAIAGALGARGADAITASLCAEMGIIVFKTAFARWSEPDNERAFAELVGETLDQFKAATQ